MIDHKTLNTFDELYYSSYRDILKYVVCNANVYDAKDIVQNIYLEVIKILKKNPKASIDKKYIMGICKHKIKDYYRFNYKNKLRMLFIKDDEVIDNIPSKFNLNDNFIKEEDLDNVWKYLKKKKDVIGKIFYLYYYEDMSIKDISKELNLTEANVKNYLYRTLKELRIMLDKGGDFSE